MNRHLAHAEFCVRQMSTPRAEAKRKRSLISQASLGGGDSWTRTNDPIDVNDVLYRLSHATMYILDDASATYCITSTFKATSRLMTASGEIYSEKKSEAVVSLELGMITEERQSRIRRAVLYNKGGLAK